MEGLRGGGDWEGVCVEGGGYEQGRSISSKMTSNILVLRD